MKYKIMQNNSIIQIPLMDKIDLNIKYYLKSFHFKYNL